LLDVLAFTVVPTVAGSLSTFFRAELRWQLEWWGRVAAG